MKKAIKKIFPKLIFKPCVDKLGDIVSYRKKNFYLDEELFHYQSIGHFTGRTLLDEDMEEYDEYIIDVPMEKLTKKQKKEQLNKLIKIIKNFLGKEEKSKTK